jgi:hypothetical protein
MNIPVSYATIVTITRSKSDEVRCRKYKDEHTSINVGFTWTGEEDNLKQQCLVFGVTLSNQSLVSNNLKRHLKVN